MYQELVAYIVKSLVEHPDDVAIEEHEDDGTLVLEVTVHESDMGRVIGKSGRVVNAIRTVVQGLAGKRGDRVTVEIV
jgi:hypothetical protein